MKTILKKINKANHIALFTHCNADLDAYGSTGAIYHFIKGLGKKVSIFLCEEIDSKFNFLNFQDVKYEAEGQFDLAITLDCSSLDRIEKYGSFFKSMNTILIDHHEKTQPFYDYCLIDSKSPATCELVYRFFKTCNITITPIMATCLYMGLMGDTGCLMHDNTNKETFLMVADLIECGCDRLTVKEKVLNAKKLGEIQIYQPIIKSLQIDNNVASTVLSLKDKRNLGIKDNFETGDIVNMFLGLDQVDISVIFKQHLKNVWRVSLRSKNGFDVSKLAISYGGGGHTQASGCTIVGNITKIRKEG